MDTVYADFYKAALKKSISIKTKISKETDGEDTIERMNIYKFCFMGLLRTGYPCKTMTHEKTVEIDKEDMVSKKKKNAAILNAPDVIKETFVVVDIDGDLYECKLSLLEEIYGDEVKKYIKGKTSRKNSRFEEDDDFESNFIMPEVKFDEFEPEESKLNVEKKEKKAESTKTKVIPYIENNPNYNDDPEGTKSYLSFLYDYHDLKIKSTKKDRTYKGYVYPLYMDESDTISAKILAVITSSDMERVRCAISDLSDTKSNGVVVEIDKISFMIRGKWEDGEFKSSVSLIKNENTDMALSDNIRPSVPDEKSQTSSFYQRVQGSDGSYINIFPLGVLKNNPETGIAPAVMLIETEDGKLTSTQKSNGEFSVFFDGTTKTIQSYWRGNDLVCNIIDTAEQNIYG